jgi:CheY-like chemotaxis protein
MHAPFAVLRRLPAQGDPVLLHQGATSRSPGADWRLVTDDRTTSQFLHAFGDRPVILVVEDDEANRTLAKRMLEVQGFTVLEATNGAEVVQVLEHFAVGVVLADLRMPVMDGHALALQVRARWPGARMVFMTGHPDAALTKDPARPVFGQGADGAARPGGHVAKRKADT